MDCADVLINLPLIQFDTAYTYLVPDNLAEKISFGKRVLVPLGSRNVEGYVVKIHNYPPEIGELKRVVKVLDVYPVFNEELLDLAQWIAERYVCPVSLALNAMIPQNLRKKRSQCVTSLISRQEGEKLLAQQEYSADFKFFELLWENGQLSLKKAITCLDKERLQVLKDKGLVCISGVYAGYRPSKAGYAYAVGDFNEENLKVLQARAPKQAEAMQLILKAKEIDRSSFDRLFSGTSINALLRKGYLKIVRQKIALDGISHVLSREQEQALTAITSALNSKSQDEFLLYGVTGSGKTEVYVRAAEKAIENGEKILVLVPEIALTRHLIEIFSARIENVAVLHSNMLPGERYDEWKRIKDGEVNLVLGTRSAVFAPLPDIGLIIIDEEQENTYKQEESPRYHAREVARKRAEYHSAVIVLGSATPSLETYYDANRGKATILTLKSRVGGARLPAVMVEDMKDAFKKGHRGILSPFLKGKIQDNLDRKEQTILFINRRGYSPMTLCRECGIISACPNCSVGLTYHRDVNKNVCHYCNYQAELPTVCSKCGSSAIQLIGIGTQKVEEEVRHLFPYARIARLDHDSSRKRGAQKDILNGMKQKNIDVLVGTQMVAKGLDFPGVSLVGIVDADSMLNLPDFRAAERTFQLIVQAAGRAGRGDLHGEVVIQTYDPDNPVIQMASQQDYDGFYAEEIKLRLILNYPPFTCILRIVTAADLDQNAFELSNTISQYVNDIIDAKEEEIVIMGPAPCPIHKLRNRFRYQLMVKCSNILLLQSIGRYVIEKFNYKDIKIDVDVNPAMTW